MPCKRLLLFCLLVACGARSEMFDGGESSVAGSTADASVADGASTRDASYDAPLDSPFDARDAGIDAACVTCLLANDPQGFYEVRPDEHTIQAVGPAPPKFLADIALAGKTLYGAAAGELITLDMTSWQSGPGPSTGTLMSALEVGPDGTIYAAAWDTVYTIDPSAGAVPLVQFTDGFTISGDLAFVGTRLFATAVSVTDDFLAEVDLSAKSVRLVGSTRTHCIYGLAGSGGVLYGFTCNGELLQIDPNSAATRVIATFAGHAFLGATKL